VSASSGGSVFMDSLKLLIGRAVWWTGKCFYRRRRLATLGRYGQVKERQRQQQISV